MCPKKAKRKSHANDKRLDAFVDAEEPSDKNTTSSASNVAKRGKEKSESKGKSVRQ